MTKDKKKDSQEPNYWDNRLAFLGGIVTSDEPSLIEGSEEVEQNDELLVPAPKARRRRPPRRPKARRRPGIVVAPKRKKPPKESPSAKARARVRSRVDELREEAVHKAMPGIALTLYREGRQYINALDAYSSEENIKEAGWYMQAAIDAFKVIGKYQDAADVLIFLVNWLFKTDPTSTTNLKEMLDEARSYLDRRTDDDIKSLRECDRLEQLIDARAAGQST